MKLGIFFFFLGTVIYSGVLFPKLLCGYLWIWGVVVLLTVWCAFKRWLYILYGCIFLLGFLWAASYTILILPPLKSDILYKDVQVSGVVITIPQVNGSQAKFEFSINSYKWRGTWIKRKIHSRLSWYGAESKLEAGQRWQFMVKLHEPRGFANPGGFNYANNLFKRGISLVGYVRKSKTNHILPQSKYSHPVLRLRQSIAKLIDKNIDSNELANLIKALTVGVRSGLSKQQWQTFRATGTSHLMAISGLHIGMVAGFIYLLTLYLWRLFPRLCLQLAAPQAAALSGIIAALCYASLAGFSIPTQRALIMLGVLFASQLFHRSLAVWQAFFLALFCVVLRDPLASLSSGFYLSFMAVALIIYGMNGRVKHNSLWWSWGRVQWLLWIGLLPISLWFFKAVSYSSFIANTVAIPWVAWLVLPLSLLSLPLLYVFPVLGYYLLYAASQSLLLLLTVLHYIANYFGLGWQHSLPNSWIVIIAFVGVLLLFAPKGWPGRWQATILLLPLFLIKPSSPQPGELWSTVMDVGQGLAVVIRTQHHTLIYDTGPRYSNTFDAGSAVIVPYLQYEGIKQIDTLLLSHGDSDHVGGAKVILNTFHVKELLTSVPQKYALPITKECLRGQSWVWDGVKFNILSPVAQRDGAALAFGNNRSCVLLISAFNKRLLLTGDIEKEAERQMIRDLPKGNLQAEVLIAPHHGSKTSSSKDFVQAVNPKYVLFATGYRNRFHFPGSSVVKRYKQQHSNLINTAETGAIKMVLSKEGIEIVSCQRNCKGEIGSM